MERHDTRNTGATNLKGAITDPEVWWDLYLGPPRVSRAETAASRDAGLFDLDGDGTLERVRVGGSRIAVKNLSGQREWFFDAPNDTGIPGFSAKVARVIPGSKGMQILAASSRMDTGEGYAWCFSFEDGIEKGKIVWQTENLTGMHAPEAILADLDGDGHMEFCLAPHYRVLILDAETGKIKHTVKWDVGRNYGLFAAGDVDGDGRKELLVICDFVLHIDMIGLPADGGPAKLLWTHRFIEGTQFDGSRALYIHAGLNALADLDGDGKMEIWFNLFNPGGDGKWHLVVWDALTGEAKADEPGVYLIGGADLDGDGKLEIAGLRCNGQRPPERARFAIFNYKLGKLIARGEMDGIAPILTDNAPPDWIASNVDDGSRGLSLSGKRFFAKRSSGGQTMDTLIALELDSDRIVERGRYVAKGNELDLLSLLNDGGSERLSVRDVRTGRRRELDRDLKPISEPVEESPGGFSASPIVADLGGPRLAILAPTSSGEIGAWMQGADGKPKQLWKAPGWGMTSSPGYNRTDRGVLATDLDGDGKDEIVCAYKTASDAGTLRALQADGSLFWEHEFENLTTGGVEAGVDLWTPGRFADHAGSDLWVSLHRRSKGSSESYVLDGRDGKVIWNRATVEADNGDGSPVSRPCGAVLPFVADLDGDGADEIGMCPYDIFSILRGRDGKDFAPPVWTLKKACFGRWLAYVSPTLLDLDGDGKDEVYMNSPSNTCGGITSIKLDGTPRFANWTENPTGPASLQAVADVDGDGKPEIGAAHLDGLFRCYSGTTGKVLWTHQLRQGVGSGVIAADADGDGEAEFILCTGSGTIVALRGGAAAEGKRVLWEIPIGAVGQLAFADVDGDARGEIVVAGSDGKLRVIGQRRK